MQILNDPRAGPPLQGDARFAMPRWVVVTWFYASGCIPPWQRSVIGVCDLGHKLLAKVAHVGPFAWVSGLIHHWLAEESI